jgi:hypothetical protein
MRFIVSFLLIIFLGSSTSMGADFPPVKTGTMLFCKENIPHTYLIEFMEGSEVKTYNPRKGKETENGRYYKLEFSINNYDTTNDWIRFSTAQMAKGELGTPWWLLTIQRDNLDLEIAGFLNSKCETIDKSRFDYEVLELKKEIEKNNKLIDEHYKRTNKI